jgi:hypothetical protein
MKCFFLLDSVGFLVFVHSDLLEHLREVLTGALFLCLDLLFGLIESLLLLVAEIS